MWRNNLWLLFLIVGAAWTALVASSPPAILERLKVWSGAVLMGALLGAFAGSAAASIQAEWQWPVGIVVGVAVCYLVATFPGSKESRF